MLRVHPHILRFARTPVGVLPESQSLELFSTSRQGVRFAVTEAPSWLEVSEEPTSIRLAVNERRGDRDEGVRRGELVIRNLDEPTDVRRVPVELEVRGTEAAEPLRSFDEDGRLQRLIRPDGGIVDYDYDRSGQLVRVRYPDGSEVSYTYDDRGHRTSMTDGQGTTVYRYDAKGRLEAVYQPGFDPLRYRYDADGRLTGITYPNGRTVSYGYDRQDRLLAVTGDAGTTRYEYDPTSGRLLGQTLPNGLATEYGYDADACSIVGPCPTRCSPSTSTTPPVA